MRSFTENWASVAHPQSPADNATLTYPQPLLLDWTGIEGASRYRLTISSSDPQQSVNQVAGSPITTSATAYAIPTRLSDGEYWWQVTPIDAEGNLGTPSEWFTFTWSWPTDTTLTLNDLDPSPQVFDPQFSWTPVPGAAYYKVDVNTDPNFPSGSNVCCTGYTVATSLAPTTLLPAAKSYYWRVTPFDSSLDAGEPTVYSSGGNPQTFTITYDAGVGAVTNLSMRDDQDNPITWTPSGVDTTDPIVSWDPVPGAASYEVEVSPFGGGACDWSTKIWDVTTVTTSWTPLGANHGLANPWPNPQSLSTDSNGLNPGASYCVRVRAQRNSDTANHVVSGTPIDVGDDTHPSFNFTGFSNGASCQSCTSGYLGSADYELPQTGQVTSGMPLFTWKPISGYSSYYVVVATDASFQNVIDYAFTQTPAYAPRTGFSVTDYPDSTYYWAVLPATGMDGTGVVARPDLAPAQTFQKQSAAPTLTAPADNASISTWPVFQWTPVDGAYLYHVEVATDQNFSNLVDNTTVDETSYTAASTYPAGQKLYWRVQAEAKDQGTAVGLAWSSAGHFTKTLPVPSFSAPTVFTNATSGDAIPVWQWNPVAGAVSYDVVLNCSLSMSCTNGNGLDTTAAVLTQLTGSLPFSWQVRANFPTVQNGSPVDTGAGQLDADTALPAYDRGADGSRHHQPRSVQLLYELGAEDRCQDVPLRGIFVAGFAVEREVREHVRDDSDGHHECRAHDGDELHPVSERRDGVLARRRRRRRRQHRGVLAHPDDGTAAEARHLRLGLPRPQHEGIRRGDGHRPAGSRGLRRVDQGLRGGRQGDDAQDERIRQGDVQAEADQEGQDHLRRHEGRLHEHQLDADGELT